MEADNFFCDEECISLATKFYLDKTLKRKVCEEHAPSIPQAFYPIEAFTFISRAGDAVLYEQRLQEATKGRKRLELWKVKAREEIETALQDLDSAKDKAVQIIEKGYEANKRRTQQLHFQIEVGIETLNHEFDSYLRSPATELSKVGSLVMTGDQTVPSLLQTRVIDNSLELLEIALQGFAQAQLPLKDYLSIVLDPELRRKEAEKVLQMAEDEFQMKDFIHLQHAVFKCSDSITLSYSDKATEILNSIELKLKEIGKERANAIEKLFTNDTQAVCSLTETYTKDIKTLVTAEEWGKAEQSYLRAISYINEFSCSKETAKMFCAFANFLVARQRGGEAETYYTLALHIQQAHFPEEASTADTYLKLGNIYNSAKRSEEAENCYKTAVSIRKLKCPNDYQTSITCYTVGVFFQELKRYQEASEVFVLALNTQRVCIPDQNNLVCILWCLGEVYRDINRYEESVQFFIQAIQEDTPNCQRQAQLYKALGDVYKYAGQSIESEESYNSALSIFKSIPLSSLNRVYLNNLGNEFERLKRFEDAEFCYQTGIMAINEKCTDKYIDALLLYNMGGIRLRSNEYSKAIKHFNAALRILVVHYPNKKLTPQVYLSLGLVHVQLSHMKEAEHCFRSVSKILDASAPASLLRVLSYMNLGAIFHKAERYEEAEQYERLILTQLETQFSNEMITAQLLLNLGALYLNTNRCADAEICFVKCLQILESSHPNQLLFIGILYYNLAKNYEIQDNIEDAVNYFVKAISLRSNETEYSTGDRIVSFEYPQEVEDGNQLDEFYVKVTQGVIVLPKILCDAYYSLGVIFFDEKQYQESEHYLTAALHHAKATGDEPYELKAGTKLKELYFNTKQFEKLRMLNHENN